MSHTIHRNYPCKSLVIHGKLVPWGSFPCFWRQLFACHPWPQCHPKRELHPPEEQIRIEIGLIDLIVSRFIRRSRLGYYGWDRSGQSIPTGLSNRTILSIIITFSALAGAPAAAAGAAGAATTGAVFLPAAMRTSSPVTRLKLPVPTEEQRGWREGGECMWMEWGSERGVGGY